MPSTGRLRYLEAPARTAGLARGHGGGGLGTLVLLHAFPLNARMWEAQMSLADQGWRVIAPHFRGFDDGPSESRGVLLDSHGSGIGARGRTIDDYAGDVVDLLDALHVKDAVVAGLSMGGYAAFALWRHAPHYIRALVLADTRPQPDTPEMRQGRERMLGIVREQGPASIADDMLPRLLGESTRRDQPAVVDRVRSLILANSADAVAGAIEALMSRADSTPLLPGIHVPTLIVVGEEDTLTPPSLSEDMHRTMSGSELVTIPGAGHLSNLEQPEAFNAALARFLAHRV